MFIFGITVYRARDIEEAKLELTAIKKEYATAIKLLNDICTFSPEQYETIGRESYKGAEEALGSFRNIFIAAAILTTKNGSHEDAISAWKSALYANSESRICRYGLGMEFFKASVDPATEKNISTKYLSESIKHLSHRTLRDDPYAQYHLAIAYLRGAGAKESANDKYESARNAIAALEKSHLPKEPLLNVERNFALAYCIASRYSPEEDLRGTYRKQSKESFSKLKGLREFDDFIKEHYDRCMGK